MKSLRGSALWRVVLILAVLTMLGGVGYAIVGSPQETPIKPRIPVPMAQSSGMETVHTIPTPGRPADGPALPVPDEVDSESTYQQPDSPDTLASPLHITSSDGKTYFVYGAPYGQNNKDVRRVIVSLPGHGTTADDGYKAWSRHIEGGDYALVEFNWWKGTGEKKTDYYQPFEIVREVRAFLHEQGYDADDLIILHGFSRGSANTYAVIVEDRSTPGAVFDAVISNAGKYQSDFPLSTRPISDSDITQFLTGVPWVLACGEQDPNPNRDGCPGMRETETFLKSHGAQVLGLLSDPSGGHGAFHMSPLNLPAQAFTLIESVF